ncbi:vigilin-like protein [Leptotrombidium deliense]|uniref:Vigilin-like protein n=1 Tax=Leptotrombidium deliense TaxID=299467 RepID=A0A443SJB7_9ACAR|nr:vigilin-like protein [Leptotrombidium deliense]
MPGVNLVNSNGGLYSVDAAGYDHGHHNIAQPVNQEYHVENENAAPSYDEIFPALPDTDTNHSKIKDETVKPEPWSQKMKVRSTNITQIFRISPHERRYQQSFAQFGENTLKSCAEIMKKTSTHIETSNSKDGTVSFLITGKDENVLQAKKMIASEFKVQDSAMLAIPKQHHRFILGKNHKKLQDLERLTGTKILVPKQTDASEEIRIVGPKDSVEKAIHEIQLIANDAASRANERITVPKIYHPFITGPYNENLNVLMEETGAKIHIPPPSVQSDEISITGETEAVTLAKQRILDIYDEKQKKCQTVCMEVKKSQHRFIIGKGRQALQDIFKQTGVSVEMPPTDSASETITLRGEQEKLGPALSVLYEKAHSEVESVMNIESWVQKRLFGPKKTKLQDIKQSFPNVLITTFAEENTIKLKGKKLEVEQLKETIERDVEKIKLEIKVKEIRVNPKFHCHIIGKSGSTINQIRDETGAQIHVPSESDHGSDLIRIEGSPESIEKAAAQVNDLISKMVEKENNQTVSKELIIQNRFHKQLIGAKGEKIREVRDKFNQVNISFPKEKSDKVTIYGQKEQVESCYKYLAQINKELLASNYSVEVPITKENHRYIIGKDGATIKKIREETGTKIDLPAEGSASDVIIITGKKENVEVAKGKLLDIQSSFVNTTKIDIIIPAKFHNSIIGAGGRVIKQIRDECGGVQIKFPSEDTKSDKVTITGSKENVMKAKQVLIEMSNDKQLNSYSEKIKCDRKLHPFLIGKNGGKIKKIRESTGARIVFPTEKELNESGQDSDFIEIVGKKECVLKAKKELESEIEELKNTVEETIQIPRKFHSSFMIKQLSVLKQIQHESGAFVSFPDRVKDRENETVTLKGTKECVEKARLQIQEIIDDLDAIECVIDHQHHRTILGAKGSKVSSVQQEFDVQIKFPDRVPRGNNEPEYVNGSNHTGDEMSDSEHSEGRSPLPRKSDIIVIIGRKKNCESAKQALIALIPITIEVTVPFDYHRFIIGQKGKDVREYMDKYDVQISVPPPSEESDIIKITGAKTRVEEARDAILKKVQSLDEEKQDRELRSFKVAIRVDPKYHPKIIGRRGNVISQIRTEFDVQVQFPERTDDASQPNQDLITITGYEEKANAAKEKILGIVRDLEDHVSEEIDLDYRIHRRLIGSKGRNIKKIMDEFRVDIRFPKPDDENKNRVVISGYPDGVQDAKDRLKELEDEYLEDVADEPTLPGFTNSNEKSSNDASRGFFVTGGPWELKQQIVPDTNNTEEFPSMNCEAVSDTPKPWGPRGCQHSTNYPN